MIANSARRRREAHAKDNGRLTSELPAVCVRRQVGVEHPIRTAIGETVVDGEKLSGVIADEFCACGVALQ